MTSSSPESRTATSGPILVTGASGFVGRHLLAHLRSSHPVVGWSRSPVTGELADAARWQQIDLTDRLRVRAALAELQPRQVYHLAGEAQVERSFADPAATFAVNVLATHHLFDGLRRNGQRARVVVSGSGMVYAPSTAPIAETTPVAPHSPYAVSKLAQEMLSLRAVSEDGLDVIVSRSFNHTGPGQSPSFVTPSIARQVARIERGQQEPVLKVGNLDSLRDLLDVRDVVRAYADLMTAGIAGEIYNVASGVGRPIRAILEAMVGAALVPIRVEIDPERVRSRETRALVGDASKLRALTGWRPQISFEQMLLDVLEYWRHRP